MKPITTSFVALLLLSCTAARPHAVSEDGPAPEPPGTSPLAVRLLDAGEEPRVALRYNPSEDLSGTLEIASWSEIEDEEDFEDEFPRVNIFFRVRIDGAGVEGDEFHFDFAFEDHRTSVGDETPDWDAQAPGPSVTGEIAGRATFDTRGSSRDLTINPNDLDRSHPQIDRIVRSLEEPVKRLILPLPEEEVGVGARWEYKEITEDEDGLIYERHGRYELIERDESRLTIEQHVSVVATPSEAAKREAEEKMGVLIERMVETGSGTVRLDLRELLPDQPYTMDYQVEIFVSDPEVYVTRVRQGATYRAVE